MKGAIQQGFTLIELMVTVVLAAIILTLGVPSFREMIQNNRMVTQANELMTSLNLARSEAIKRGVQVTMCKASSSSACSTSANWESGWLIFPDGGTIGTVDGNDSQNILRFNQALPSGFTLRTGGSFADWIGYLPNGNSRGNSGLGNDTFRLCFETDTANARSIIVNTTGRPIVQKGAASCP